MSSNLQILKDNVDMLFTILSNEINIEGQKLPPLDLDGFDFLTLNMCAAILCVSYNIKFSNNELLIAPLSQPLIENAEMLLKQIQTGGTGELVKYKQSSALTLSRRSFKNLLWLIFGVMTIYITTMLLSYKFTESLKLQDRLAKIKYNSLKQQLGRPINSPKLTELSELAKIYQEYDATDETNKIDLLTQQKYVLIEYVEQANEINGKLLLPPPGMEDESEVSSGDQLIGIDQIPSVWGSISIITRGTTSYIDTLLAPYKGELEEWQVLASRQTEEITDLQEKGSQLISSIKTDYEKLHNVSSSSTETVTTIGDIFGNLFDYMIGTTKVSQVSNIEGKIKVAHEIFKILPSVAGDLLHRVPNVPYEVIEIYNHYENVLNQIMAAYALSTLINSILIAFFGWLINYLIADETMSDEEKQQVLEDAVRNLSQISMGDVVTLVFGNNLTQNQLQQVVAGITTNIIPVHAIQEEAKADLFRILQEPIIQQSFEELIAFNKAINRRSSTARENQMIANFLETIYTDVQAKTTAMVVYKPPEQGRIEYGGKKKRTKKTKKTKKAKKTKKVKKAKKTKKAKKAKKTKRRKTRKY
jgi:hypothetical protein